MTDESQTQISLVLAAAEDGDTHAAASLLPLVYDELKELARKNLARERPGQTLQPTALVHEAWLRISDASGPGFKGRTHFFVTAARAMRRILVDQARRKNAAKRAGQRQRLELDDIADTPDVAVEPPNDRVLDVDDALTELEQEDPRKAAIIHLRYFAGLSNEETAGVLELSVGTVEREWRFIRALLQRRFGEP